MITFLIIVIIIQLFIILRLGYSLGVASKVILNDVVLLHNKEEDIENYHHRIKMLNAQVNDLKDEKYKGNQNLN